MKHEPDNGFRLYSADGATIHTDNSLEAVHKNIDLLGFEGEHFVVRLSDGFKVETWKDGKLVSSVEPPVKPKIAKVKPPHVPDVDNRTEEQKAAYIRNHYKKLRVNGLVTLEKLSVEELRDAALKDELESFVIEHPNGDTAEVWVSGVKTFPIDEPAKSPGVARTRKTKDAPSPVDPRQLEITGTERKAKLYQAGVVTHVGTVDDMRQAALDAGADDFTITFDNGKTAETWQNGMRTFPPAGPVGEPAKPHRAPKARPEPSEVHGAAPEPPKEDKRQPTIRDAVNLVATVASTKESDIRLRTVFPDALEVMGISKDGSRTITMNVDFESKVDFDVLVNARRLRDNLAELEDAELSYAKDKLTIKSARGRISMNASNTKHKHDMPVMPVEASVVDGDAFRKAINRIRPIVGEDAGPAHGLFLDDGFAIAAKQTHIIAFCEVPGNVTTRLHPETVSTILALGAKKIRVATDPNKVWISGDESMFVSSQVAGDFLPWRKFIDTLKSDRTVKVSKSALEKVISVVSLSYKFWVRFELIGDELMVSGNEELAESQSSCPASGDMIVFGIEPKYVKTACAFFPGDDIHIHTLSTSMHGRPELNSVLFTGSEPKEKASFYVSPIDMKRSSVS